MEKYEKIKVVGRGAYGTVYLCRRLSDKKLLIIKQIPVEQMTKDERQTALNEVKVLSMLNNPFIIKYYENFLEDKALMIVMEYAQGGTLFELLQSRNGQLLDEEVILHYFAQMLLSLQHVDSKQILHRDLKTQNILLDKKKQIVKIGDFGISKVLSSKSKAYTVVGTPCYLSPELCSGMPYNQKSDIWALGCVLYEMVTLKRAFEASNLPALIIKIVGGTFEPIPDIYSEESRSLILSMLHRDPSRRPTINQIITQPRIINHVLYLYTDWGKIPSTRVQRPLSSIQPSARNRQSVRGGNNITNRDTLSEKAQAASCVYYWGGGIPQPLKLTLPSCDTQVIQVAAGRTQKAAVTKSGRLFVWESTGITTDSVLPGAVENSSPAFIPRYLEGQAAVTIQHVSCGDLFAACLTDRGILMTLGSGANGCLGHGNFNDVTHAKIVEALLGYEVMQVSCGASHVLAVTNEHEVFAWGRGDNGRLGLTTQESCLSPSAVPIPENMQPFSVHCGVDSSIILTVDKKLLSCGNNRYNKLGLDTEEENVDVIFKFTVVSRSPLGEKEIKNVALGTSHTAVVTVSGECFTFGSNQFGQLGYETEFSSRSRPQRVDSLESYVTTTVACGDTYTIAVTEDSEVFSWGNSSRGRLGRNSENSGIPQKITFPDDPFTVTSVSCSYGNTLIATKH
ncbi:serine/threonine-protein kinase Nek8 isoform X1 [Octopus bimaculoides]|uniref:Serine/threonine-protein kinase Nek8 n=2 Tax=Octopus bimaculoides TaxID=37653 RepID=A0A0L8HC06_OCTBM|nr:serine/threonine-protein kinase Nek8 isoform X1 [Octopus bimaculoides]|eukprot:XP_014773599.1 PREDICTED: serine/threonine-protein kinase Nek8-like isoform X1 [Octopus bimaculoides]